jgi:hypothetical protein
MYLPSGICDWQGYRNPSPTPSRKVFIPLLILPPQAYNMKSGRSQGRIRLPAEENARWNQGPQFSPHPFASWSPNAKHHVP